jgi:Domain of unknown function (DUF4432)
MAIQSHLLTDRQTNTWRESIDLAAIGWSIRKRMLHGSLSDGVEVVDVKNGALAFTILPTRGMGLWKGRYKNLDLGWSSPVIGPVHPKFVELSARGGLGWLTGFDEWLCRCGLAWNGPPGDDEGFPLSLHGRIANLPAHRLEIQFDDARKLLRVIGDVDESGLFYPHLSLRTTYATIIGANGLEIEDVVVNRSSQPTEMQLLYHLNVGPPFLEAASRVHIPIEELWPNNARAAEGIETWDRYAGPVSGFAEQVYLIRPTADGHGRALALLHNAAATAGVALRWDVASLPYFNLWKNTASVEDGYVTGLEPATGFPRFRASERAAGRVPTLAPGGAFTAKWTIEVVDTAEQVAAIVAEAAQRQGDCGAPIVHRTALPT